MACKSSLFLSRLLHKNNKGKMCINVTSSFITYLLTIIFQPFSKITYYWYVYDVVKYKTKYTNMKDIKFTSCSPLQTCLRFSGTTTSRLHKACSFSNSSKISGILKSLMLLLYSFTSQITNMAPVKNKAM